MRKTRKPLKKHSVKKTMIPKAKKTPVQPSEALVLERHRKLTRESMRALRRLRIRDGECAQCGEGKIAKNSRSRCETCLEIARNGQRKRYESKKSTYHKAAAVAEALDGIPVKKKSKPAPVSRAGGGSKTKKKRASKKVETKR